jgi:hypothetical protein
MPMGEFSKKITVYHIPRPDDWNRTDSQDIDPPVFRDKLGRMHTIRRKGKFEVPYPRDTSRMASITCNNCKLVGHRYTICQVSLIPGL